MQTDARDGREHVGQVGEGVGLDAGVEVDLSDDIIVEVEEEGTDIIAHHGVAGRIADDDVVDERLARDIDDSEVIGVAVGGDERLPIGAEGDEGREVAAGEDIAEVCPCGGVDEGDDVIEGAGHSDRRSIGADGGAAGLAEGVAHAAHVAREDLGAIDGEGVEVDACDTIAIGDDWDVGELAVGAEEHLAAAATHGHVGDVERAEVDDRGEEAVAIGDDSLAAIGRDADGVGAEPDLDLGQACAGDGVVDDGVVGDLVDADGEGAIGADGGADHAVALEVRAGEARADEGWGCIGLDDDEVLAEGGRDLHDARAVGGHRAEIGRDDLVEVAEVGAGVEINDRATEADAGDAVAIGRGDEVVERGGAEGGPGDAGGQVNRPRVVGDGVGRAGGIVVHRDLR